MIKGKKHVIETWDIPIFTKNKPNENFCLVSGTFNPPHLGHFKFFKKVLRKYPKNWLIISPHNLSETKQQPVVPLEIRREWLRNVVLEKFPDDLRRIVLNVSNDCEGNNIEKAQEKFTKILESPNIIRLRGDRESILPKSSYEIVLRDGKYSSSIIRELLKNGNFEDVKNLVPQIVFKSIIDNKFYFENPAKF